MAGPIYQQNELGKPMRQHHNTFASSEAPPVNAIPGQTFVSATAELGPTHNKTTYPTGRPRPSTLSSPSMYTVGSRFNPFYDDPAPDKAEEETGLDPEELIDAMRSLPSEFDEDRSTPSRTDTTQSGSSSAPNLREGGTFSNLGAPGTTLSNEETALGTPFKIEWVHLERLDFHRIHHLRNTWNRNLEVKVSRDGTELDPDVGQKLLEEWDRLVTPFLSHGLAAKGVNDAG